MFDGLDAFHETIYHSPAIGFSGDGKANVFGDEVAYRVRIARRQRTVAGKAGQLAISRAQIWFDPSNPTPTTLSYGDKIRLPAGVLPAGDTTTTIIAIDASAFENYLKVYL